MSQQGTAKELLGAHISQRIKDKDVIGLGTGSSVEAALIKIGARIKSEKITVFGVASSRESAELASSLGIIVLDGRGDVDPTWGFDGADYVDKNLWCIKGKGGALLGEKLLAAKVKEFIVLVDSSKEVETLDHLLVPVEVFPESRHAVVKHLNNLGAETIVLRTGTGKFGATVTEKGNIILDVAFKKVVPTLERDIRAITGVVESGLFMSEVTEVLTCDGVSVTSHKRPVHKE